jgi:autotransporter-associated beta strand protein
MTSRRIKCAFFFAVVTTLGLTAHAQLLHDDFNGTSIDTSLWQVSTPFPNSSMTESGGNAVFENRGRLLSVASLRPSVDVFGRFEFTGNIHDQFQVVLRTNGATTNPSAEFDNGIHFKFAIESDTGSTADQVYISDTSYPNPEVVLTSGTYPLALNTFYNFRITDNGTQLALYINDLVHPFLTATDSNSYGLRLGLYNREGNGSISAGSITQLDFITAQTRYMWSTTTTGFAWLNATHWSGNQGHYPGVDTNVKSIADGASNDIAAFSTMAFASTSVGVNFSFSYNNGLSDNTGANGSLTLGAIDYLTTTNKSISIGDNSGSAGTLTLTGVTLNGVANTILANEGSNSLTLAPQIGGGTQDMTLALGNAANNVIQVNGSGSIIISAAIQDGAGVDGSLTKTGPGMLTLSHPNTYTGATTIKGGTLAINNTSGSGTGSGPVLVKRGRLSGTGTISGAVTVANGTTAGAALQGSTAGTLTINNTLTFNSPATYICTLKRTSSPPKMSKVSALGVTINSGVTFAIRDRTTGTLTAGTSFTVINNTSANPIFGRFSNLADGSTFSSNGTNFHVNYEGGDGNDLTLAVVP